MIQTRLKLGMRKMPWANNVNSHNHNSLMKTTIITLLLLMGFLCILPACKRTRTFYEEGVSIELANYRAKNISEVHYDLWFSIPANSSDPVLGEVVIHFRQHSALHGVNLDFQAGSENIRGITVNGQPSEYTYMNQHILIPSDHLVPGKNAVEIAFVASNQALNRADDFMYTLFVPDRASTAFPCFDQPDMKATFSLSMDVASDWLAISNGPITDEQITEEWKIYRFEMKQPISTYLFAFAAGRFQSVSQTQNGRTITMLHRENDTNKLNLNSESIFRQHFESLAWLEKYTAIPYPYEKFDIVILPGFQYSGMEHPGAVWYRDERLFLNENAPLTQQLRKASLIAHETAHMWFGNFVTIKWFDDVWLKEVFAGFMADKIIAPQFPEINHDLQFVLSHFPRAYSIDRSMGTHPIKQTLANMKMAGTLYGPIIYNKAPVIFRQLETIMQPENFQEAVQEYLQKYAHASANWDDLVEIFDKNCEPDIVEWSKAWVYGTGMPQIRYQIENQPEIKRKLLKITQINKPPLKPFPSQWLRLGLVYDAGIFQQDIWFDQPNLTIPISEGKRNPKLEIMGVAGMGYGYFLQDRNVADQTIQNIDFPDDENLRAALQINLFEHFLNGGLSREDFTRQLLRAIEFETNPQIINYLCNNLTTALRCFPDPEKHTILVSEAEALLWNRLNAAPAASKQNFFDAWLSVLGSRESLAQMQGLYSKTIEIQNFNINETHRTTLACEIALRSDNPKEILQQELLRIENPDRKRRFAFLIPALSGDDSERNDFFESLKKPENRKPEPWVLDALNYLHHPFRNGAGAKYIPESLEMLEEIQRTGDIFLPKNWLDAILGNYHDEQVAKMVRDYLDGHPMLPENLRLKVLQSADLLFRNTSMPATSGVD